MTELKKYTGSAYIGVVGPELENGIARDSILNISRRPGDNLPRFIRATKGYEARQMHLNSWINETKHEYALFLDHDNTFETDTLEKLRRHQLPYVSGYYLRRRYSPMAPVWFKPYAGHWPLEPWSEDPEPGKLHELGASGWGCILLHREVVMETRKVLKDEEEIIEDDMDVWPYDLRRMMGAIQGLQALVQERPTVSILRPALEKYTEVLASEFRPLRGSRVVVGSDIRFPFYAREAGYKLYGDSDVRCGHMLNYPLHPNDYTGAGVIYQGELAENIIKGVNAERQVIEAGLRALEGVEL